MSREFTDTTGAPATIDVSGDGPIRSYTVRVAPGAAPAGRADFVESDADGHERIFFHTEVDPAFSGRGLAGLLIRAALADATGDGSVVVPVCRLFAAHLRKHGDEFATEGGRFRSPRPEDVARVGRALSSARARA